MLWSPTIRTTLASEAGANGLTVSVQAAEGRMGSSVAGSTIGRMKFLLRRAMGFRAPLVHSCPMA
jgi:hypothetical protein